MTTPDDIDKEYGPADGGDEDGDGGSDPPAPPAGKNTGIDPFFRDLTKQVGETVRDGFHTFGPQPGPGTTAPPQPPPGPGQTPSSEYQPPPTQADRPSGSPERPAAEKRSYTPYYVAGGVALFLAVLLLLRRGRGKAEA